MFKENCPDLRNTRVVDIIRELADHNLRVSVYDPWIDPEEARREYGVEPVAAPGRYDAIIIAVAHDQFRALGAEGIRRLGKPGGVVFDVKWVLPAGAADGRL